MCERHERLTQNVQFAFSPDEGSRGNVTESHPFRDLCPMVKLGRVDVFLNLEVALCGPHVLTKSDDVDINVAQVCKYGMTRG